MKILYVEDNDDNVYMLKNRLSRAGFTVIIAIDGMQGVAMAASEQPDLILMDLTLPDIDVEEATRRIKGKVACIPGLPVCKAMAVGSVHNDDGLLFRHVHVDAVRLSLELKTLGMRSECKHADLPTAGHIYDTQSAFTEGHIR
jgi:CheY-like chemotaxis protein